MKSNATSVSEYLIELPESRKSTIIQLRELCVELLNGYEEVIDYGMPCYKRNNVVEVAFASQKNYISLYIAKQGVMKKNKSLLDGLKVGKECINYTKPETIDFMVVRKLLIDTVTSDEKAC